MEKKKAAKALMVAAALAGGITVGQSFFNEAQATGASIWRFAYCFVDGKASAECHVSSSPNCGLLAICGG